MKFGKTLAERTLKEWRFYYVDYKELKQSIKKSKDDGSVSENEAQGSFNAIMENAEKKIGKFYHDKLGWATSYITTLDKRVEDLRESASGPGSPASPSSMSSIGSVFSDEYDGLTTSSPTGIADSLLQIHLDKFSMNDNGDSDGAFLKEAYRQMGASKHFQDFIYAKKSLVTFNRELGKLFVIFN